MTGPTPTGHGDDARSGDRAYTGLQIWTVIGNAALSLDGMLQYLDAPQIDG
ncbi:MAG: hypothetical protein V1929_07045 [bacterium]